MTLSMGDDISSNLRKVQMYAGNVTASGVNGAKEVFTVNKCNMVAGSGGNIYSGTSTITKQKIDVDGQKSYSATGTNMSITGGYMPVSKNTSNDVLVTRVGDFVINKNGQLESTAGLLRAWKLDDNGNRPGEGGNSDTRSCTELTSLDIVTVKGLTSRPKATSMISLDGRLDATAAVIKGPGQIFQFSADDSYNATIGLNDVIVPTGNTISQGDNFSITINNATTNYTYGGVANTVNLGSKAVFGASSVSNTFNSVALGTTSTITHATVGDKLRIAIGNSTAVDLKFVTGAPRAASGEFNSVQSLCDAINAAVPGAAARVVDNTLFIAATNGTSAITFTNIGPGATNFKGLLGLTDVLGSNENRFSTVGQLKTLLQANNSLLVKSTTSGSGIDIAAKDPLKSITFTSSSSKINNIYNLSATQSNPATGAGAQTLTSFTIHAPFNKLNVGDFVKVSGLTGNAIFGGANHAIPSQTYVVLSADSGGFTIAADALVNCGGVGQSAFESVTAGTWQKVTGTRGASVALGASSNISSQVGNEIQFNKVGHGFASNDVVYISGIGLQNTIQVPDGQYKVTVIDADNFTISVPGAAHGVVASGAVGGAGTAIKVGTATAATTNAIESSIVFDNLGAPSKSVRIAMPNSGFNVDDYFKFGGAVIDPLVDGKSFKITQADNTGFTFEMESNADAAVVAGLNGGVLGAANWIDYFGKFDTNINYSEQQDGIVMHPTFDPAGNSGKNLVTGGFTGLFEQAIEVYDNVGIPHLARLAFGKIGDREWAFQLYAVKDEVTNTYPLTTQADGIITSGHVTFDGSGNISSSSGMGPLNLVWNGASDPTIINLNFGAIADPNNTSVNTTGGLKQVAGASTAFAMDQDGYKPGVFVSMSVSDGQLIAQFDNNKTLPIYTLAICFVANPNEMSSKDGLTFNTTNESGGIILRKQGEIGIGVYEGNSLEGSNIDNTVQLVYISEASGLVGYLAAVQQKINETEDEIRRRT